MAADKYSFETLAVRPDVEDSRVLEVALNRPEKLNAMNGTFFREIKECLDAASSDASIHCVVIHGGSCRIFTAGLDLASAFGSAASKNPQEPAPRPAVHDPSRRALKLSESIGPAQEGISALERCIKPVIVAAHNAVIGGGVDLMCAADVRYCSEDATFSIMEVKVGLAADVGTLQRLPKIVGNDSAVRELALTGRKLSSSDAKELGLVSKILPNQEKCIAEALKLAREIAALSPTAIVGTKASLNFSRDHTIQQGLDHIRLWNSVHLQSEDVRVAVKAQMTKSKPTYSKL